MSDEEQKKIFARNLNKYLSIHNLQQKEVAKKIGVIPTTFNSWCTGQSMPRMGKVQALADFFGIQKSDLIEEKKDSTELTKKDKKEIDDYIDEMRTELLQSSTLLFDGQPAEEEDIEAILNAMKIGAELVKKKNKEKYTPKKYKKG